jgi:hypothetical protein
MEHHYTFTDLREAYEFYMRRGGILITLIPCKKWQVTVFE